MDLSIQDLNLKEKIFWNFIKDDLWIAFNLDTALHIGPHSGHHEVVLGAQGGEYIAPEDHYKPPGKQYLPPSGELLYFSRYTACLSHRIMYFSKERLYMKVKSLYYDKYSKKKMLNLNKSNALLMFNYR